jgi:hypothetical protein
VTKPSITLHCRSDSCTSARQANEIASQTVTKVRELATAAYSDAVSRPDPDADELPRTMLTLSLGVPTLPPRTSKAPHHIRPMVRLSGIVNLSKLEQFECITLASKPLKIRNPASAINRPKLAKSVKLTMPSEASRVGIKMNYTTKGG